MTMRYTVHYVRCAIQFKDERSFRAMSFLMCDSGEITIPNMVVVSTATFLASLIFTAALTALLPYRSLRHYNSLRLEMTQNLSTPTHGSISKGLRYI